MKKSIIRILTVAFTVALAGHASADTAQYPTPPKYTPFPNGEFPIKATYALYQPFINQRQVEWVKEAGFNIMGQRLDEKDLDSLITVASRNDIKVTAATFSMNDFAKMPYFIKKYGDNPTVWGFSIADEPNASKFEELSRVQMDFNRLNPNQMPFYNLLPIVSPKQLGAPDYFTYVSDFVKIVNPPFISYDKYPVMVDKNRGIYVEDNFYLTLETIAKVAKDSGRPFWAYILSTQHWKYPKAKKEYLRFHIFTNLAYGAQGLSYFTYLLPDFDRGIGDFSNAPIDSKGKRTDVWKMVRDVNKEVHNLTKVFLGAEVIDVSHTGSTIPESTHRLSRLPAPFTTIENGPEGLVVSHLRNGDSEYLVIVNHDVLHKQRVKLPRQRPVTRIYPNGKEKTDKGPDLTLDPGGYAIFRL